MEKTKTILLLHGFKRNGVDDFEKTHPYFEQYKNEFNVINLTYFENYDKSTLNDKYLNKVVNDIVDQLKDQEEVIMMGYSTGGIIGAMIASRLPKNVKTHIFAMMPPIKIVFAKWIPMGFRIITKERKIKKRIGKERYTKIKKSRQENRNMEKYPVTISIYINKLRKKYQKLLLNQENIHYLLAAEDTYVNTPKIIKKLEKRHRDYEIRKFKHDLLLKSEQYVFEEWFEDKFKDYRM